MATWVAESFSSSPASCRQVTLKIVFGLILRRELVAMLSQPLLGHRDQKLHFVAFLLAEGGFQVLPGDAGVELADAGFDRGSGRFGTGDLIRGDGVGWILGGFTGCLLGRLAGGQSPACLRTDDHHQDDQDADEVGHHVQERVLAGSFGLIAVWTLAGHRDR